MNNLFVFHGVDHKVGTTMISQSVAEYIANEYKDLKVLFITLNGRESADYVSEVPETIEGIKSHLDSKMVGDLDFLKTCRKSNNFYMLGGIKNEAEERLYFPDTATYLLSAVSEKFDIVISDSGNEIDNGLAVGALTSTVNRFLIITQQETILNRWERMRTTYEKLEIHFNHYILNKFYAQDPYSLDYITERLEIERELFKIVEFAGYSRQAEMEAQTLLEYKNIKYIENIADIANIILVKLDFPVIKSQRKSKWKNFI